MQFALVDGQRIAANPGLKGVCPVCNGGVVARCGSINAWHWAHEYREECDSWSEGESDWHITWKRRFPVQWQEVVIDSHRADIKSPQGVVELQASSISTVELSEREQFYNQMAWVVNAVGFNLDIRDKDSHLSFRWKHPRKTWWHATKPVYFDIGDRLLEVKRLHNSVPCGGWGRFVEYDNFVNRFSRVPNGMALCERCRLAVPFRRAIETTMYEYCTMDIDPMTVFCPACYEGLRYSHVPIDPDLFDCLTPLQCL